MARVRYIECRAKRTKLKLTKDCVFYILNSFIKGVRYADMDADQEVRDADQEVQDAGLEAGLEVLLEVIEAYRDMIEIDLIWKQIFFQKNILMMKMRN